MGRNCKTHEQFEEKGTVVCAIPVGYVPWTVSF